MNSRNSDIAVINNPEGGYPEFPYNPSEVYPELKAVETQESSNSVYDDMRKILMDLKLDEDNIGTEAWNPLKELVEPGQKVVIKPNYVRARHPIGDAGTESMITHSSVIRPIIDFLLLATNGDVRITIADVPLQSSDWELIIQKTRIKDLVNYFRHKNVKIELLDLRREISYQNDEGVIVHREINDRDPLGYTAVDLKNRSKLMPVIEHYKRFEITDYGSGTVPKHHNPDKNEYFIPNTILSADLFICVPKLKTHRKAGITCAMKNLVGINGDKSWLAHHRRGIAGSGGDEYKEFHLLTWLKWHVFAFLKRSRLGIIFATILKKIWKVLFWKGQSREAFEVSASKDDVNRSNNFSEGSWYGNDTIWRCVHDLNHIIFYADKAGELNINKQRKYMAIVDGIISGEREGPMEHTPKNSGVIIGGFNPVAVDYTAALIMGFDWKKIPQIREAVLNDTLNLLDMSEDELKEACSVYEKINLNFIPTKGWLHNIEKEKIEE